MEDTETYLYDLHVHTKEISPCGSVDYEKMIELYKNEGYQGVVLTDHFRQRFYEEIGWEQAIDKLFKIYEKAKRAGQKVDLDVFLGLEVSFNKIDGDFLVFGVDEEFLKTYNKFPEDGLRELRELIAGENILVYEAHPFRNKSEMAAPELLDGLEVYNGNPRHDSNNHLAYIQAEKHNLGMIAGSDFHEIEDLGQGGIALSERINSNNDLIRVLQAGNYKLVGEELPFIEKKTSEVK